MKILRDALLLALGVGAAAHVIPGIHYDDGATLFLVALILTAFNLFLKPLFVLFALPFVILSLGLGILLINALFFWWAGSLVPGFHVDNFWSALGGSLVVSAIFFVASLLLGDRKARFSGRIGVQRGGRSRQWDMGGGKPPPDNRAGLPKTDDVIDV